MALLLQIGVNLPRWGLKLFLPDSPPLGVNLPRWGLKLGVASTLDLELGCKFTPLGFETRNSFSSDTP